MRRLTTLGRGSYLRGRFFNALQDEQRGRAAATQNPAGALALVGGDGRYACTPDAGVADGTLAVLDTGIDWRARLLAGYLVRLEGSSQRLHGANAWQSNDVTRPIAVRRFRGSTGTGGLGAAAATVANGTPPVVASGSFAVVVDEGSTSSSRVWLYARPSDGALCVYNASGATLHAEFDLESSAVAPNPSAPAPDVIPTLTDVQWITPSLAAARPADPGGPALHRATDTGAVSLYDGGAWRMLQTTAPVIPPAVIPLGGFASYDATQAPTATPVVVGGSPFAVDPADFTGTTWTFTASGSVVSGQSVTLTLYDRTAGATAATLTIGATTQTAYSAAVTTPGTARLYELRFGVSGTTTSHYGSVHGAALKIGS